MDENLKNLICKVLDGTASPQEVKIMNELKETNPDVQTEFDAQKNVVDSFRSVGLPEFDDKIKADFAAGVYNKIEKTTGWTLSVIGIALVFFYGLYEFITQPRIETVYKVGFAAMVIGIALLFASVLRLRHKLKKHDKYKEVIR